MSRHLRVSVRSHNVAIATGHTPNLTTNTLETRDDIVDFVSEAKERWNNRLTLHGQALTKAYLKGRLPAIVNVNVSVGLPEGIKAIRSTLQYDLSANVEGPTSFSFCINSSDRRELHEGDQKPVLIFNVESVQTPDEIIPSFVRLDDVEDMVANLRNWPA